MQYKSAFTLMEMMVVVVVVSVVGTFALPAYQKSVTKSEMRAAINNMVAINAAEQVYKARYGHYWPNDGSGSHTVSDLNQNLNLNMTFGPTESMGIISNVMGGYTRFSYSKTDLNKILIMRSDQGPDQYSCILNQPGPKVDAPCL